MAELVEGISTSSLPILNLILVFIGYLVIHIIIAKFYNKKQDELRYWKTTIETEELKKKPVEEIQSLEGTVKLLKFLNNWFPAIAVVLIIIMFYS